ncbi:flagellar basal-body MS-ring/collar protein FliF [Actibacterium sp. D379-3]
MQQIIAVWSNLDPRRRVIVALATLAMFAAILAMSRMATTPQMALLYSGLKNSAAGEVVQALEQRGAAYEVRNGAIYVDGAQRDELRMTLASEGLPAAGGAGYELLDNLSGFGTTSQMFDAAYWRAKEGELARTILANPQIRSARVHIANSSGQPFRRDLKPTAAITVTTGGGTLSPGQAKALKYLVASSVAGLSPEDVSVIDAAGGLVVSGDEELSPSLGGADRAEILKHNVERLLSARMGPGKAVVEVSVDTVTDRESIVERRFDPDSRVAISTDTEERSTSARDQGGAAVTVASNLPDGDAGTDRNSSSSNTETRERVNFEVSETQREVHKTPGAIKRITVAVMLDGLRTVDDTGTEVWRPLPDAELRALEELVASAVGFDAARGDVITLRSMPFDPVVPAGTLAEAGLLDRLALDLMALVQLGVLSAVLLVLGLFVLRPILSGRATAPGLPAPIPPAESGNTAARSGLTGEIDQGTLPDTAVNDLPVVVSGQPAPLPAPSADPVERLRQMIEDRRAETIEILRHWMEDDEEPAR